MTALEALQMATSTGVLAGGLGILKWALSIERRVIKLELQGEVKSGRKTNATA